jgi:hypothetical protein
VNFGHRVYRRGTCRRDGSDHDMGESCFAWARAADTNGGTDR